MINVADLVKDKYLPGNYFASDAYIKGDFESGLIENRRGDRLLALPETFLKAIYLGLDAAAIADYDQAIHLNTNYTEAYYNRGLACIELGRKKQALKDCRAAAKLFFAKGDIENYQKAKSFSQEIYELKTSNTNTNNMLLVGKMSSTTVN